MSDINGHWYPARSSSQQQAVLNVSNDTFSLLVNGEERHSGSIHDLKVSDRTGNIARRITLPDESLFETDDNDQVDAALTLNNHTDGRSGVLHRLESSWRWVAVGVVVTAGVTFSFFKWGLPAAAMGVAHSLPISVHEAVADGTLETLDEWILQDTQLSQDQQNEVRTRFDTLAANLDTDGFTLKLHFRDMHGMPNAFALPSGDIVVTDALVALADPPEELDAVLYHEVGHVVERHGMQHAIQASTMTLIVTLAIGDLSGVGELLVSLPVFLMQSSYSRKSESSADQYAFREMVEQNMDPRHFASIIRKLGAFSGTDDDADKKSDDIEGVEPTTEDDEAKLTDYLSSHPGSEDRAIDAETYSDQHFQPAN